MKDRENKLLLLTVFLTGASVMILEITAMRLFAPFFGNTLYTTSSVIGVILGALSLGYYIGGRFADKNPSRFIFSFLIALSGITVFALHVLHQVLLPLFAHSMSINTGSILFSITFFLIPNIFLGMLSPYAIKIRSLHSTLAHAGKNSGEIFFASTVGSIVGSFLTGFYLIPTFGVNEIMVGTSLALVALGLSGFFRKLHYVLTFVSVAAVLLFLHSRLIFTDKNIVYQKDGVYQKLIVRDALYRGRQIRGLVQDLNFSSAMYKGSSDLVFDYSQYAKITSEMSVSPKTALVLGAGAYTLPKYFLETYPDIIVDVVDIEPFLYSVSKEYFELEDSSRLNNVITDGRLFLKKNTKKYDVIFLDVYGSLLSVPSHFTTKEFFALVKDRLTPEGILIANIIGATNGMFANSLAATWKLSFPQSSFYAVESANSRFPQNMIYVGCLDNCEFKFKKDHLVSLPKTGLKTYIFTDNYAPIDYLIDQELALH